MTLSNRDLHTYDLEIFLVAVLYFVYYFLLCWLQVWCEK